MIQFICFSRKRPLQLHGYLTSLFAQIDDPERITVSVLARVEPPFEEAYAEVEAEFPQAVWRHEMDFGQDLAHLIGDAEYTCFGCDDAVFVAPVRIDDLQTVFLAEPAGVSFRLGRNVVRDMFGSPLPQPRLHRLGPFIQWDITDGRGDWVYLWEVLGTVYRTDFVQRMVPLLNANSPSQLEDRGSRIWAQHTDLRYMAAYPTSRLVVPTVNIVQSEFPNGITGELQTPEALLERWQAGDRLDVDALRGLAPESWRIGDFPLRQAVPA